MGVKFRRQHSDIKEILSQKYQVSDSSKPD